MERNRKHSYADQEQIENWQSEIGNDPCHVTKYK
jgi:hypothetical protein